MADMDDLNSESIDLDDKNFIRHKLFEGTDSKLKRYAKLVLSRPTFLSLLRYEFLILFVGPIPGSLGLILRKLLFPSLFECVGRGVVFGKSLTLRHPEKIKIGNDVILDDYTLIDARGAGDDGICLGNRVIINRNSTLQAKLGKIEIADNCSIGTGSIIISQGDIFLDEGVSMAGGSTVAGGRYVVEIDDEDPDAKNRKSHGSIYIGKNVRLGMGSIIQDGVHIGQGAIVGPGSVVLSDVGDYGVVFGSPARPWRRRTIKSKENVPTSNYSSSQKKDVERIIKSYLRQAVFVEFGEGGLAHSDSFLDNGILDSVGFIALVVWLTEEFGVQIDDLEMVPKNLDNLNALVKFIIAKQG